jgi:hypothetical protein
VRRPLAVAVVGLLVAAAATGGAALLAWPRAAPTWPGGVALVALAGVAGVAATGGVPRRLVGVLLALVGVAGAVAAVTDLPAGGAWLAGAGALILAAAGAFVLVREPGMPRFGSRYARAGAAQRPADPDRAAWQDLDEGRDPTV